MALGDMNNYEWIQLEFETEQLLNYVTMSTINAWREIVKLTFTNEVAYKLFVKW